MNERIIENQRRMAFALMVSLARQLTPGKPFALVLRSALALNKGIGSRDRRIYRELVFTWLRHRAWFDAACAIDPGRAVDLLVALAPDVPEMMPMQSALGMPGGIGARPWPERHERLAQLVPGVKFDLRALLPAWFEAHCPALFSDEEILLQLSRPPFWLRAQRGSAAELVRELARSSVDATASTRVPGAVRVGDYIDLEDHPLVTSGRAEVQDIGSQALVAMTAPASGERWLDFCAGAGGKSLQLAQALGPKGAVTSHDVRRDALMELRRRMLRAEIRNIVVEPVLPEPGLAHFAGVLVDAPCSASGTWRRHPFLRHQTNTTVIARHAYEQVEILRRAAAYVAPYGRLIYATCSLSHRENEDVVAEFFKDDRDFIIERPPFLPGITPDKAGWVTLMPSVLDSDGYFLACLRRRW